MVISHNVCYIQLVHAFLTRASLALPSHFSATRLDALGSGSPFTCPGFTGCGNPSIQRDIALLYLSNANG